VIHLIKRFFGHLRAEPLRRDEVDEVSRLLSGPLADLFWGMGVADQRHAFEVYRRTGSDPQLAETALLHDVGKTDAPRGSVSRAVVTVLVACRIPVFGSWAVYRDHARIGADMLTGAGASTFTVAFTRTHPGVPVPGVDADAWERLAAADRV